MILWQWQILTSELIQQSLEFNGIPFTIRKYNAETEAAFAEVEEMKKHPELYKGYNSADELFENLDKWNI